jgi:hypothetical protein
MCEGGSQLRPAAMNPASNGSDLDVKNFADLFVAQTLDVAQHDGCPKFWRQSG